MKLLTLTLCGLLAPLFAFGEVADLIRQADALDRQLKTAEALAVLQQAEQAEPQNAEVLHRLAKQYGLSMDDVSSAGAKKALGEKALAAAQRAVAADARNPLTHLALAVCYGRVAKFQDNKTKIAYSKLVRQSAETSLKLDGRNDLTYYVLGAWNFELANLNPILRAFASALYGTLPSASNETAIDYFKKAAALNPNRIATYVEMGRSYAALGKKDEARTLLEKALAMPNRDKDDPESKARGKLALGKL